MSLRTIYKLMLIAGFSGLTLAIWLSGSALFAQIETQFKQDAATRSQLTTQLLVQPFLISDYTEVQRIARTVCRQESVAVVEVLNSFGDVVASCRSKASAVNVFEVTSEIVVSNVPPKKLGEIRTLYSLSGLRTPFRSHFLWMALALGVLFLILVSSLHLLSRLSLSYFEALQCAFSRIRGKDHKPFTQFEGIREFSDLSRSFNQTVEQLRELSEREKQAAGLAAVGELAAQVVHDIRSPLMALHTIGDAIKNLAEPERLLFRRAVARLQQIAASLKPFPAEMEMNEQTSKKKLVAPLIESLVAEKKREFPSQSKLHLEFLWEPGHYLLTTEVDASALQRVLSNLINNAVEALVNGEGSVEVSLRDEADKLRVLVRDTGVGIPSELIPRLANPGATFNKANGTGLGLSYCKKTIESWGGNLFIQSNFERGNGTWRTTISFVLPKSQPPEWLIRSLSLPRNNQVVILDDDTLIHSVWEQRFSKMNVELIHLKTGRELETWVTSQDQMRSSLYLIDQELNGELLTGVEWIESLHLQRSSVLVTGRFDDPAVQTICLQKQIPLLPKTEARWVPIASGSAPLVSSKSLSGRV